MAITPTKIIGTQIRYGVYNQYSFAYFMDELIDNLDKYCSIPKNKWVILMDNAGFHTAYSMLQNLIKQEFIVLFTSPYHPGCNPIEHLFSDFKHQVRSHTPRDR